MITPFLTTCEVAWYIILACLSVGMYRICMSVCRTITFESLDVGSSYLHIWCISREYGSNLYIKVKVKVTGAKRSKMRIHAI